VLDRAPDGSLIRKCGVMAVAVRGGEVRMGDAVVVTECPHPDQQLEPV
jgi:MOSC domain-containing protein YiiM